MSFQLALSGGYSWRMDGLVIEVTNDAFSYLEFHTLNISLPSGEDDNQ